MIYVSAYYYVPKPTLPHMGLGRYLKLMPESFKMIRGSRLHFFYDEQWVREIVSRLCAENEIELVDQNIDRRDLIGRGYAEKIYAGYDKAVLHQVRSASKKEKGLAHYRNLIVGNPAEAYIDNATVWLSKIDLVNQSLNLLNDKDKFCWVDIGVSKFQHIRENWRFWKQELGKGTLNHYGSRMEYQGRRLPLNASFLSGGKDIWHTIQSGFYSRLQECCTDGYLHDEETILSMLHRDSPERFHAIGQPYSPFLGSQRYLARRWLDR